MNGFRKPTRTILALMAVAFPAALCFATDPYLVLERFADRARIPRLLSTADFGLSNVQPEALQPVWGDFNGDRRPDVAISGVYTLPGKSGPSEKYFLLVVSNAGHRRKSEQLLLEEAKQPYFLHKPGTTGEGDPGNQAFSLSFCINCSTGTDFHWDAEAKAFRRTAWTAKRFPQPVKVAPPREVDPKVADEALKIAGALPDVKRFVNRLVRAGAQLVTRVEPVIGKDGEPRAGRARVLIYERSRAGEELYDAIEIDTRRNRVIRRGAKRKQEPE